MAKDPWVILSPVKLNTGYVYGSRHLTAQVDISAEPLTHKQATDLCHYLNKTGLNLQPADQYDLHSSLLFVLHALHDLQKNAGYPVDDIGFYRQEDNTGVTLFIPLMRGVLKPVAGIFELMVQIINASANNALAQLPAQGFEPLIKAISQAAPPTGNIRAFIAAAHQQGTPVHILPGAVQVYGQGKHSRLLESSYTDKTPIIGSAQARNKPITSQILQEFGLPVQPHRVVMNIADALRAAENMGYPVVVKPTNLDRGEGVAADLQTPAQVENACKEAFKLSRTLMVEKHFYGKDYRITVLDKKVIWAVERVPGSVTGDGQHSVRQLIDITNRDPMRSNHQGTPLKTLLLDDEAIDMLDCAGLSPESIPATGQFVCLRRSSNITKGGVPIAVLEHMHPDNKALAVRAADALRMDLTGIDLLIPDIRVSWRESGAAICEINAQPTIGTFTAGHLYAEILQHLLQGNGRIPLILVAGDNTADICQQLTTQLMADGYDCGTYDGKNLSINQQPPQAICNNSFSAGRMLTMEQNISAMVIAADNSLLQQGLPFARYDVLVTNFSSMESAQQKMLQMILPACDGQVLQLTQMPLDLHALGLNENIAVNFNPLDESNSLQTILANCAGLKP